MMQQSWIQQIPLFGRTATGGRLLNEVLTGESVAVTGWRGATRSLVQEQWRT